LVRRRLLSDYLGQNEAAGWGNGTSVLRFSNRHSPYKDYNWLTRELIELERQKKVFRQHPTGTRFDDVYYPDTPKTRQSMLAAVGHSMRSKSRIVIDSML